MSEVRSGSGEFVISLSRHTLTPEEIPTVIRCLARIAIAAANAFMHSYQGDVLAVAEDVVQAFEEIEKIKLEIED